MNQKFIVALDSGTAPQRDAISSFLHQKRWDVWHWIADVWFLNAVPDEITPRELWSELVASDLVLTPIKGLALKLGDEMVFWGGNVAEAWPWLQDKWGRADFPKPQPGPA